jgi:hypothetical protein
MLDSAQLRCHHRRIHPLIKAGQIIANPIAQSETTLLLILTDDPWQSLRTCRRSNRPLEDAALSYIIRVLLCAAGASVRCSEAHILRPKTVTDRTLLGTLACQLRLFRGNCAVCEGKSKSEAAQWNAPGSLSFIGRRDFRYDGAGSRERPTAGSEAPGAIRERRGFIYCRSEKPRTTRGS